MWTILGPRLTCRGCVAIAALVGVALGFCEPLLGLSDEWGFAASFAFLVAPGVILGSVLALRCRTPLAAMLCGFTVFGASIISEMTARWTHNEAASQSFL